MRLSLVALGLFLAVSANAHAVSEIQIGSHLSAGGFTAANPAEMLQFRSDALSLSALSLAGKAPLSPQAATYLAIAAVDAAPAKSCSSAQVKGLIVMAYAYHLTGGKAFQIPVVDYVFTDIPEAVSQLGGIHVNCAAGTVASARQGSEPGYPVYKGFPQGAIK